MTVTTGGGGPLSPVPLPPGIEPLPALGEGVVGTHVAASKRRMLRIKGGFWSVLAVGATLLAIQSAGAPEGLVLGVVIALATAFLAGVNLAPALMGDRPALTVDADVVRCLVPLSRVAVRLDAITRVRSLRRDLLIEARGGVLRRGRPTREHWAGISYLHTYEVGREDLAAYVSERANRSRAGL